MVQEQIQAQLQVQDFIISLTPLMNIYDRRVKIEKQAFFRV